MNKIRVAVLTLTLATLGTMALVEAANAKTCTTRCYGSGNSRTCTTNCN